MQRGLTRSWGGFPPGFDLQHPACSPAPSQRTRRRPRFDLNHFLCGIPAGEAQLHEEGSSLGCEGHASSPRAPFSPASPCFRAMLGWKSGNLAPRGTSGLVAADLFSGSHALAGVGCSPKAARDGSNETPPCQTIERSSFCTLQKRCSVLGELFFIPRGFKKHNATRNQAFSVSFYFTRALRPLREALAG